MTQATAARDFALDPPAAAAVADAFALAARGEFGADDTVVLPDTCAGNKDVDTLRSHLGAREEEAAE